VKFILYAQRCELYQLYEMFSAYTLPVIQAQELMRYSRDQAIFFAMATQLQA
jgi:hypothetical protein